MRDDQSREVIARVKAVLRAAELVITKQDGFWSSEWVLDGLQLTSACWVPKKCQNPPRGAERFLGCGNFSLGYLWEKKILPELPREIRLALTDDEYYYPELRFQDALEKWIDTEPFVAKRFNIVGMPWMYYGTWSAEKNRWMIGPKVRRPGC